MATINPLMTIVDLEAMPDDGNRYEIIEGELFVSCAPGLAHQIVSDNTVYLIRSYLADHPLGIVVSTPRLILTNYSSVIPDVVFFTNDNYGRIVSGERLTSAPDPIVEILSSGAENLWRDRVAKRQLYSKHGVSEYWIVDGETKIIEVYRLKDSPLELDVILKGNDPVSSPLLPGSSCSTDQVFSSPS